jgi:hypothetical protein
MIDFRIERDWSYNGYQAWVIEHRNGRSYIAEPVELKFKELSERHLLPEPTLRVEGIFAKEFIPQLKKALAGFNTWEKDEYEVSARIEKAMQAHIDSLKLVVDRALK